MKERWVPVAGFEDYYEVSDLGRIRSFHHSGVHRLRGSNGNKRTVQLHRLIAEHFVPNPNNLPMACHRDDNNRHNSAKNLKWGTPKSNGHDALKNQRFHPRRGIDHKRAKLTEKIVQQIHQLYKPFSRTIGIGALAKRFGVERQAIANVIHNRSWHHVKPNKTSEP